MFSSLDGFGAVPLDWPNARVVRGDAVEVVARLEEESDPTWKIFQRAADFDLNAREPERTLAHRPTSRSVRR